MILITGINGFIASYLIKYLNKLNISNSIIIDTNYNTKINQYKYSFFTTSYDNICLWDKINTIIHLGAISDTLEKDKNKIQKYNIDSTKKLFDLSQTYNKPFIFASTAAVYGNNGSPLNLYAESKLTCEEYLGDKAVILRLFNVYGHDESHKGRMASTIYHWYNQLTDTGTIKIFRNSNQYFRDFVYVKDICRVIHFFISKYQPGTYDIGTGVATSFEKIADIIISQLGYGEKQYIDMPHDLKNQYQIYTKANIQSLKNSGYNTEFISIEDGIRSYIDNLNLDKIANTSTILS